MIKTSEFILDLNAFCTKHNCSWKFNMDSQLYEIKILPSNSEGVVH